NTLYGVPPALQDRMETIRLPGYLETEKVQIGKRFLVPKQRAAAGLGPGDLKVSEPALRAMVNRYTREAGVRNLEREIAKLARKVARKKASDRLHRPVSVTPRNLHRLLGPVRFLDSVIERTSRVGVANGLAWTETGGGGCAVEGRM